MLSGRLQLRTAFYLSRQVRRSIDQEPASIVAAAGDARLRLRRNLLVTRGDAVRAGTVPLRQATTRRPPGHTDANRLCPAPIRSRPRNNGTRKAYARCSLR